MNIIEKGKGSVSLTKKDFVASGGEGSVYAKGSTAYKIYADPSKMISVAKIKELSSIKEPKVIRPLNILLDSKNNNTIGYSMRYLKNTYSLCQAFTKSFKDRNNISPDIVLSLVRDMQNTIKHIHEKGILIVDVNEMNFLIDSKFSEVYFIDVDSYKTPSFPATALMESVRDRHSKKFSEGSDWFSFAVVSFQLFMGIHPYKGKLKSSPNMSFEDRMLKNISVFNKDVGIPKICPSFDVIPEVYRKWYVKVFEEGFRGPPPFDLNAKIDFTFAKTKVDGNNNFVITLIKEYSEEITKYMEGSSSYVVLTNNGDVYYENVFHNLGKESTFSFTLKNNYLVGSYLDDNNLINYYNINLQETVKVGNRVTKAKALMSYGGRLYAQTDDHILEILFLGNQDLIASPKVVGNIMEKATTLYDGVAIQNLMGVFYASIFPESGKCYQIPLKFLEGYKIVDAKFDHKVLMVIGNKNGIYDKFIIRLDDDYLIRDERIEENLSVININFVCLPNGVVAHLNDKENLELFTISGSDIKEITGTSSDMKLCKNGTAVYFLQGNSLFSIKTK